MIYKAYPVLVCVAVIWEGDRHISDVLSSESLSEHTCKDIFMFHNYDFFFMALPFDSIPIL